MEDTKDKPGQDDLVQPMGFEIDPKKYTLEQIEKAVKKGYKIEGHGDEHDAVVVERTIVKGSKNKDLRDVSE